MPIDSVALDGAHAHFTQASTLRAVVGRAADQGVKVAPFPHDLHTELATALRTDAVRQASVTDAVGLCSLSRRASRHALASGMTPESMVIALRHVYQAVGPGFPDAAVHLRDAYDRMLSRCLKAYFDDQQRDHP